jgi:uncharacterized cysteine cluster protein YcgN (CxxCxxCC family)
MTEHALAPFWRTKPLEALSPDEWESLCDGCGRCCLVKLEEEETNRTYFTDVACFMLDGVSCQCSDYPGRKRHVPDCVTLTPDLVRSIDWLPPTCAYRLVADGEDLYWWHPLVSGDPDTVHAAGVSVRGRVGLNDRQVGEGEWEDHVVRWPMRVPKRARRR